MLDFSRGVAHDASKGLLRQLFQGRPYTKVIPFQATLSGAAGEIVPLWLPLNAYFEVNLIRVKVDTTNMEVTFCDTDASAVINFGVANTADYSNVQFGISNYRSLQFSNPKLLLVDFSGVVNVIKGVIYGWEVTPEGYYR